MKKTIKIFLIILLSFISCNEVYALDVGDSLTLESSSTIKTNIGCKGCKDNAANITKYSITSSDFKGHFAYCLDVQKSTYVYAEVENIIEPTDADFNNYYAGLIKIIENGYSKDKTSGYGVSGDDFYSATNIALRAYVIALGESTQGAYIAKGGDTKHLTYQYTLVNTTALWMSENKTLSNNLLKVLGKKEAKNAAEYFKSFGISGAKAINYKTDYNGDQVLTGNNAIYIAAKEMFYDGIEAAASFDKNVGLKNKADAILSDISVKPFEKVETASLIGGKVYYPIKVSNFKHTDKISNLQIICENCKPGESVTITGYSIDGVTYKSGVPTDAILGTLAGNSEIILEIKGMMNRSGNDCKSSLKYKLKYDFETNDVNYKVYILRDDIVDGKHLSAPQRMLSIIPEAFDDPNKYNRSYDLEFKAEWICGGEGYCEVTDPSTLSGDEYIDYLADCCSDLEALCKDNNNPAQSTHCSYYAHCGGNCETVISVPTACTYLNGEGKEVTIFDGAVDGEILSAVQKDANGNYNKNIKTCLLIRQKDENGNSYKTNLGNSYCDIFCEEDFDFKLPAAVKLNSGTYFQLNSEIKGTKSCYTSKIDVKKYKDDISKLTVGSAEYNQKTAEFDKCVKMEDVNYNCFNPIINYEYAETFEDALGEKNKFVTVGDVTEKRDTTYCTGEINDDYSCKATSTSSLPNIDNIDTLYVKTKIEKNGKYTTPRVFYQIRPTGAITTDKDLENAVIVDGLPVAVNTEKGSHIFKLSLTNIGEYYDQTNCESGGRLIGGDKTPLKTKSEYQCYYHVNCPECEFECVGPLCYFDECDGPRCTSSCLGNGCAYDTGINYGYRTVSLNKFNPTGRTLGYNWDSTKSVKAAAAIGEIEALGEGAYEKDDKVTITLTPALISYLKAHNKDEIDNGGYANNSLKFEDYTYNGKTYKGLYAKSKLLEELEKGEFSGNIEMPAKMHTSWLESDYCKANVCTTNNIGPAYK